MTRPKDTIPIKLSRQRAQNLADWLKSYTPPELTALGTAGMSAESIALKKESRLQAIRDLVQTLKGPHRGRPRKPVSLYYLPRPGLRLIDSGHAALNMPTKIRGIVRIILRASKVKKGPKLLECDRKNNISNGYYSPEMIRHHQYIERKAQRQAEMFQKMLQDPSGPFAEILKPTTDKGVIAMRAMIGAHRKLI